MLECIPNISSANKQLVNELQNYLKNHAGCTLYHIDKHRSVNRSVFTYFVEEAQFIDVNFDFFRIATTAINMKSQSGLHPRIGAIDVFPVVPVGNTSKANAIALTNQLANIIGEELSIPVYLYEHSQNQAHRNRLEQIRKGGYERFNAKMQEHDWQPDFGPSVFNTQTGATVMGVRDVLIAVNFGLANANISVANNIAKQIRTSGYLKQGKRINGMFNHVKAIGWKIPEYTQVQVSVNITNYHKTPLHEVYLAINQLAKEHDTEINRTEIIGLLPEDAVFAAGKYFSLKEEDKNTLIVLGIDNLKLENNLNSNLNSRIVDFTSLA